MTPKIVYVRWLPRGFVGMAPCPQRIYLNRRTLEWSAQRRGALIDHEMTHIQQMARDGYWRWLGRYFFHGYWRVVYELEAYVENILFLSLKGIVTRSLADYYVDRVRTAYFPWWWPFGRRSRPTHARCVSYLAEFVEVHNKEHTYR